MGEVGGETCELLIDGCGKGERSLPRQCGGTGEGEVPGVFRGEMRLLCTLEVLPRCLSLIVGAFGGGKLVFVLNAEGGYLSVVAEELSRESGIVLPSVALCSGKVAEESVAMDEKDASAGDGKGDVGRELWHEERIGKSGCEELGKGLRVATFPFDEDNEGFGGVMFEEVAKGGEDVGFPIGILKDDAMVDAELLVIACLQADVEATDACLKLLFYGEVLCLKGFTAVERTAIMSAGNCKMAEGRGVGEELHPLAEVKILREGWEGGEDKES